MTDAAFIAGQIGDRVREFLLSIYPSGRAKDVARGERVALNTAKAWLGGALPQNSHMAEMARRYGARFVAFVYEPACGPMRIAVLDAELETIKERLHRLQQDIGDAQGRGMDRSRDAQLLAAGGAAGAGPGGAGGGAAEAARDGAERGAVAPGAGEVTR